MAVRHGVKDTDNHFIIDPVTRTIGNPTGKLVLIQYDHNSERFTFECPRYVDDHDMSLCNRVEIHYINTGTNNTKNTGVYEVNDLQVSPDGNTVTCSWLISQNATQNVGKLNFVIRFACIAEDGIVEYAWNTSIYSDIIVAKSIYNGQEFIEDYVDVLEMWKQDLYAEGLKFTSVEQTTTSTKDGGINIVTMTFTNGSTSEIQIRNGSKGSKGDMGVYIASIDKISGDGAEGSTDTYSINMSDGNSYNFKVYNGADGNFIESIRRVSGDGSAGSTDIYAIDMSDGGNYEFAVYNGKDGKDAVSISSIKRTSGDGSSGSVDTYAISMSDGTESTFHVYNGADGRYLSSIDRTSGDGSAGTLDTYTVTFSDGATSTFQVYNGADGSRISSIKRTSGNGSSGSIDTYTVDMTDGTKSTFQVYNGADGKDAVSISTIKRTSGNGSAGTKDVYTITMTDNTTSTFEVYNGRDGKSITSVERTSGSGAAGTTDTYTVTFNDNSTFNFSVYNGADGIGAGDMVKNVYDPNNKNTDVFAYIDNKVGQIDSLLDSINGE